MNRERTRTLLLTWMNYPCCKRLSVRVCSCSVFPPSPWVQLCTAADSTVSPLPASWVNRLLSVNRACLWHSSLLHTIWFQGKFSPSVHAHCFWCSKEGIARFCPSEIFAFLLRAAGFVWSCNLIFFFLLYVYPLIHMANIPKCNMPSTLFISRQHLIAWKFMEYDLKALSFLWREFCSWKKDNTVSCNDRVMSTALQDEDA